MRVASTEVGMLKRWKQLTRSSVAEAHATTAVAARIAREATMIEVFEVFLVVSIRCRLDFVIRLVSSFEKSRMLLHYCSCSSLIANFQFQCYGMSVLYR